MYQYLNKYIFVPKELVSFGADPYSFYTEPDPYLEAQIFAFYKKYA